ncbi:MAG: hypothetical protein CMC04_07535 [Flavobacteriaceae bacterium]|nr:hypothetical protein [Flavobacteriaceae bacterium]
MVILENFERKASNSFSGIRLASLKQGTMIHKFIKNNQTIEFKFRPLTFLAKKQKIILSKASEITPK